MQIVNLNSEVNIPNLTKLINHLKLINRANFDMRSWFSVEYGSKWNRQPAEELIKYMERGNGDCGTAGCIAGHINLLFAAETDHSINGVSRSRNGAEDWLGLTYDDACYLFIPWLFVKGLENSEEDGSLTLERVIGVLEYLKNTAEAGNPVIDWFYNERLIQ